MHGLICKAVEIFLRDTYGADHWNRVARVIGVDAGGFEAMMRYPRDMLPRLMAAAEAELGKPSAAIFEDIGTYLVSHPNRERIRRLMRFGGVSFLEFLHSLEDLPGRARMAVDDLALPELELTETGEGQFTLLCDGREAGWGHVFVGLLRAMADDYGALAFLEHGRAKDGREAINITVFESAYARGKSFELGAWAV